MTEAKQLPFKEPLCDPRPPPSWPCLPSPCPCSYMPATMTFLPSPWYQAYSSLGDSILANGRATEKLSPVLPSNQNCHPVPSYITSLNFFPFLTTIWKHFVYSSPCFLSPFPTTFQTEEQPTMTSDEFSVVPWFPLGQTSQALGGKIFLSLNILWKTCLVLTLGAIVFKRSFQEPPGFCSL